MALDKNVTKVLFQNIRIRSSHCSSLPLSYIAISRATSFQLFQCYFCFVFLCRSFCSAKLGNRNFRNIVTVAVTANFIIVHLILELITLHIEFHLISLVIRASVIGISFYHQPVYCILYSA